MKLAKLKTLVDKGFESIKHDGMRIFCKKVMLYTQRIIKKPKDNLEASNICADVLFITGCILPHPVRYRVAHQREQLMAAGMNSIEVFYESLTLDMVKNYRVFIFFRCINTPLIEEFIKKAKSNNKRVIYDVDDLVIDVKYTSTVSYLDTMEKHEREMYDYGVREMQKLLVQCDAAITTTERLAEELKNYVPEVFINRNVASASMVRLSILASYDRDEHPFVDSTTFTTRKQRSNYAQACNESKQRNGKLRIGYFSGSITHNEDFEMVLGAILRLMDEFPELELVIIGELTIPDILKKYGDRIISKGFMSWEKLPWLVASVDINLAPIKQSIFNEAKSENKWLEAALVKVATVASNVGAFKQIIEHDNTGVLCNNQEEEWYNSIKTLLLDKAKREQIGKNAHDYAIKNCTTISTSRHLYNYIKNAMTPNFAFILPSMLASGGALVAYKHCLTLKKAGYDAYVICEDFVKKNPTFDGEEIFAISSLETRMHQSFNACVATLWTTLSFCMLYPNIKHRLYLVQSLETNFYEYGDLRRFFANSTYNSEHMDIKYLTVSKWCQEWLKSDYDKDAMYIPNGLNVGKFLFKPRTFECDKIRILIEGNCEDRFKNVDESFKIVNQLDLDKYEIWYLSYQGKPKDWYHVDKFYHKVPYDKVPEIYSNCDILLKSSTLESFSYPPLEMMASGGVVVVRLNEGNKEYLVNSKNCLIYSDEKDAVDKINLIAMDLPLRNSLASNGYETAQSRSWSKIEPQILAIYEQFV